MIARSAAIALATLGLIAAPAVLAAGSVDIGYLDQGRVSALPQFQRANKALNDYGTVLQREYTARARNASPSEQQRLALEFRNKMGDRQRQVLGPLLGKAQIAIASIASSKSLSVVIDKRIVILGGVDITDDVRNLLGGVSDPVPPVSSPPPSSVGYVDQLQIDAVPKVKSATDDFARFKADQDKLTSDKLKAAKTDADRNAILKDYQKTLEDRQNKIIKPWVDRTRDAMSQVARRRGLVLVVDRGDVIFGGTDITADVTSLLK